MVRCYFLEQFEIGFKRNITKGIEKSHQELLMLGSGIVLAMKRLAEDLGISKRDFEKRTHELDQEKASPWTVLSMLPCASFYVCIILRK